jgi:hypothetical protein
MTLSVLATFALLPQIKAAPQVAPAPDGCYPRLTTAEGCNALASLTSGIANTAVGWFSQHAVMDGSFNTAVGAGALDLNNSNENTAVGTGALLLNTTGDSNTAVGAFALINNSTSAGNTAIGDRALQNNTNGYGNTATGVHALLSNTTGVQNTANGFNTLIGNTSSSNNTAIGAWALSITTGNDNVASGAFAGSNLTTGNDNVDIASNGMADDSSTMRIGYLSQSRTFITGIRGVATGIADAIPVLIDSVGQLGTMSSSRRFKKEIEPMDKASEAILALKPVTFHYKSDNTNRPEFGLIAEEVADVNPGLVVRDENGEIYTVRYEAVNAMLLNEFLKEHKKVEEQATKIDKQQATIAELKSTVAQQQKGMEVVTAQLKEQAAQIQKVSAQLEVSKPATKVVVNKP